MKRIVAVAFAAASLAFPALAFPALADDAPIPPTKEALQKQIAGFDPKAVSAAQHYFGLPSVRSGLDQMMANMDTAVGQQLAKQNPSATPEKLAQFKAIAAQSLKERADLILDMDMVNALRSFTTGEIVALDNFYSSPEGASILSKMPKVMAALPGMVRSILPGYFADVEAKVKAAGGEFKL